MDGHVEKLVERIFQAHKAADPVHELNFASRLLDAHIAAIASQSETQHERTRLRDFFAGAALEGMLSGERDAALHSNFSAFARASFRAADAMLEARNA